jgi:hypothetical protein
MHLLKQEKFNCKFAIVYEKTPITYFMLCLYTVNKLELSVRGNNCVSLGRNIQTLPRAHKCLDPPLGRRDMGEKHGH